MRTEKEYFNILKSADPSMEDIKRLATDVLSRIQSGEITDKIRDGYEVYYESNGEEHVIYEMGAPHHIDYDTETIYFHVFIDDPDDNITAVVPYSSIHWR